MARKIEVEIVADASSLERSFRRAGASTKAFQGTVKDQARKSIVAGVQQKAELQKLAGEYRLVASNAKRGSEVQITASRLAAESERKLAATYGGVASSVKRSGRGFSTAEKDLGRFGRGGVAASGAFRGLGRSIAFASASFIGGVGIVSALRTSVNAAKEAQVAQAQLRTQFRASGISYKAHREEITKTIEKQGELSGFMNEDLTKSFTGFVRRTGDVRQALKLNAVATDIARAKGKDLASVQQLLVRALAGNARAATSLGLPVVTVTKNMDALRASGVKATAQQTAAAKAADKLATGQAVIASAQKRFGGQAAAFGKTSAGAQARFQRALRETEITIGNALLPSLTKLFQKLASYLNRLNRTGQLQRTVAKAAHILSQAFHAIVAVVHALAPGIRAVVGAVGGAKNAFKILTVAVIAFKLKSAGLANPYLVAFGLIAAGAAIAAKSIEGLQKTQLDAQNRTLGKGRTQQALVPKLAAQITSLKGRGVTSKAILARLRKQLGGSLIADDLIAEAFQFSSKPGSAPKKAIDQKLKGLDAAAKDVAVKTKKVVGDIVKKTAPGLTSAQKGQLVAKRNAFFDSLIDARTNRAQNLPLGQQITALSKIAAQLTARIRVTKDITRKLKLEQELFDIRGQRKDAQKQLAQNLIDARTARQFRELGLTATGDAITPGVANLKKRLGSISKAIQGTFLDTNKTKGVLARIRKVLSEGLVPKDVRAKLKEMLDGLTDELKNHQQSQQTKFRHVSTNVLLSGLGLSPEQFRKAQARLAQLGAGNTLPGQGSAAFAGAGAGTTTVNTTVNLDGKTIAKNTTAHQRKIKKRRTPSRRGPYAGHT